MRLMPCLMLVALNMLLVIVTPDKTLKRGLFLAFCYTFVCLLYVSLYYTEPYSNNYGYDESNIPKSVQDAHSEEVRRDADHKEPKKGEEGTRQEETQEEEELLRDDEMVTAAATPLKEVPANTILKPNSTGMPWINYKTVLTNQSVAIHCGSCAIVSSSGQLLGRNAGKEIDANDCVIRMNDAPVNGYENDVGSRTSIRVVGHTNIKKSFGVNLDLQKQLFEDPVTRTERVVVHFFQRTEIDELEEFDIIEELARKYPNTDFNYFTSTKMKFSEKLFLQETGISRAQARTWFSTGWFTLLYAIDTCESVNVYGMVHENYCDENPEERTPYHYYDITSRTECGYYRVSEIRLTGGHLFITEKAVFAQWSRLYKIYFHFPEWKTVRRIGIRSLKTPFLKRYEIAGHHLFSRYPWWKLYFHFAGIFYPLVH
ncbi:putative alpha-N-acetylgalactosaminide alpha-2,6-sialyltransferase 5-like isoform X2 [Apostichopus japonicus]|uniref:Putative alpha-N-acetylgalactosaminide alpha-2,6-sialyltransferase 5-like isoform X2 n=1 Tax=Stichopus japonicus TaxID=307972 RepID=A0A2G8KWC7_STIJA|nr:putative alpha-N-acetylgalactosaminide alpha-2,6-sialyltransferase 5-like isoform X2 [Apostichopus japonicus]